MLDIKEIKNLSREEKLIIMEALWEDLSRDEEKIESPSWHEDALKNTKTRFENGNESMIDWDKAKKKLRNRFE